MKRRIIALVLALCLLSGACWAAPAAKAAGTTMYIASNTLRFYKSPSASSKSLGTLGYGDSVVCLASSDGWAKVKNAGGAVGYCKQEDLTATNPNTLDVPAYVNTAKAPVYKLPDASTAVWTRLKKNAKFTAVAMTKDNLWVRLKNGKYYGYIQAKYLSTASASPTDTPKPAAPGDGGLTGTVYVTDTALPVYAKPSASSKCLGHMYYGQSMSCVAVSDGWAKVKNGAKTGYCQPGGISAKNPNNLSRTVYVNTANAPVHKTPTSGAAVWTRLKKNAKFTAVAVTPDGVWTRLKNGTKYAYILSKYLSASAETPKPTATPTPKPTATPQATATPKPTATPTPSTVYVGANLLTVYASASTSAKSVGTVSYGESVTLLETSGVWAKVRSSAGKTGYCAASGLTKSDPNTYSQTVYIVTENAPVYRVPSADAQVWTKLKKNTSFRAVAITGDGKWFRLQNGQYFAYIEAKHVSAMKDEGSRTVYVTDTALSVYADASTSAKGLGSMYFGQSLTLIGSADGWAKVQNGSGAMGYCQIKGLTAKNPNTLNRPYYAKNKSVQLYAKPVSGASAVATVAQGDSLMAACLSSDGSWARIALSDGNFAYALMSDLSDKKITDGALISDIDPVTVYVVPTTLTVYASTSTAAKSLGVMSFGESMTCTGKSSSWARVKNASGAVGYCDVNSVTTKNPNTYSTPLYAQASGAKVYAKPQTSAKILGTMALNAVVTGVSYNSDRSWYRVKSDSGAYGYVQAAFFATTPMADSGQSGKVAAVIALAKKYLGVPYVYGGQSPSGFDCSGFVYYVFKNAAGITLKRTAYTQGYDTKYNPTITNKVDLKVGDVVFFDTVSDSDKCDHAGIYLGNNQFIHASSGGGKVMISSLGTSTKDYYFRVFSWGRRIIK